MKLLQLPQYCFTDNRRALLVKKGGSDSGFPTTFECAKIHCAIAITSKKAREFNFTNVLFFVQQKSEKNFWIVRRVNMYVMIFKSKRGANGALK